MTDTDAEFEAVTIRSFAPLAFFGALTIIADQASQLVAALPSFDPGLADWRFRFSAMATSRFPAVALAVILAGLVAHWVGRRIQPRITLRLLGLGALFLVAINLSLWFDGDTVKGIVPAQDLEGFLRRWLRTLAVSVVSGVVYFAVAWPVWRRLRSPNPTP